MGLRSLERPILKTGPYKRMRSEWDEKQCAKRSTLKSFESFFGALKTLLRSFLEDCSKTPYKLPPIKAPLLVNFVLVDSH